MDTEFLLFNTNGFDKSFNFIPTPSHREYKVAIEVGKNDIDKWLLGMYQAETPEAPTWINSLLGKLSKERQRKWQIIVDSSITKRYISSPTNGRSKEYFVYPNDEIIFQRIIQQ